MPAALLTGPLTLNCSVGWSIDLAPSCVADQQTGDFSWRNCDFSWRNWAPWKQKRASKSWVSVSKLFVTMPSFGMDCRGLGKLLAPSHSRLQLRRVAVPALEETKNTQTQQIHRQHKGWLQTMISTEGGFCKTHGWADFTLQHLLRPFSIAGDMGFWHSWKKRIRCWFEREHSRGWDSRCWVIRNIGFWQPFVQLPVPGESEFGPLQILHGGLRWYSCSHPVLCAAY